MTVKKQAAIILGALSLFFLISVPCARPQETASPSLDEMKKTAPKVFVDGYRLDMNYIRTEIPFVNYVRDRKEADVHVLITQQGTGSGGREYTLSFIGLNKYEDLKNELKFYSNTVETTDEVRKGLTQILKLGLAPYLARTPISSILNLGYNGKVKPTSVVDKWNFWVFNISARGRLNGEASRKSNSIRGSFSISRITPEAKLRLSLSGNIDESKFDYEDYKETSSSKSRSFDGLYAKSLGEHWSLGMMVDSNYSTYSNIAFGFSIFPAVEFNVFPYSESTRRQLRILYRIGYNYDKYIEDTIYSKMSDTTIKQALSVTLDFTEPWGNAELSIEGSNYFLHRWEYTRFRVSGNLSLRLIKGLSLTVDGRYSAIHDQLNLRKGEASVEELLLRRTELASNYSYQISVGLSFSFGSVYSNVVNPRFGGGFGGQGGDYYY